MKEFLGMCVQIAKTIKASELFELLEILVRQKLESRETQK